MDLETARGQAAQIEAILRSSCTEIQVAGSVRRGKLDVHDLEFVLLPVRDNNMFGEPTETYSGLDMAINSAIRLGRLAWDTEVKCNGPKLKRLKVPSIGLIVELYVADEQNFGNLLTIRTGHSDFSQWLVTSRAQGEEMPTMQRQQEGYLWDLAKKEIIPCRTEEEYFAAVGVKWIPPEQRTAECVARLKGRP